MFLHKDGLRFFILEVEELKREISKLSPHYGYDKVNPHVLRFRNKILKQMRLHLKDVFEHIEKDNLLDKIHSMVKSEVLTVEKALEDPTAHKKYLNIVSEMTQLHGKINIQVDWLYDNIPKLIKKNYLSLVSQKGGYAQAGEFEKSLKKLLELLNELYMDSEYLGKMINSYLTEIQKQIELKEKLLKSDEHKLLDFEKNFRSWIHDL